MQHDSYLILYGLYISIKYLYNVHHYIMLDTGQNSCTVSEVRMVVTFGKEGGGSDCKGPGKCFGGILHAFLLCRRVGWMVQSLWEIHYVYIKKN